MSLLTFQLGGERGVVFLQLAQATDVGPVGRADEVREHVHLAEHVLDHGVGRGRMGEESPVGAWNIAAPQRLLPKGRDGGGILGLRELIERQTVRSIESFLQMNCARLGPAGEQDPQHVQVVLIGRLDAGNLQPDKKSP